MALSADGTTALIGAEISQSAYVFTLSNGTWSQTAEFSGPQGYDYFGQSVVLSADGTMAVIGGPYDNNHLGPGGFYVYTLKGGTWSQIAEESAPDAQPLSG